MIIWPFILSFLTGFLFLNWLFTKQSLDPCIHIFLSLGVGLGFHAYLVFFPLLIFDRFSPAWTLFLSLSLLLLMALVNIWSTVKNKQSFLHWDLRSYSAYDVLALAGLVFAGWPLWLQANLYPLGGWDAWSAWNLKAKFIFLGDTDWKNLFDPTLWRSSPHYPLLLPLMTVWGWLFVKNPDYHVPLLLSFLFTMSTGGLLFGAIKSLTGRWTGILGVLWLFSLPLFATLATSQYCDIVLAYYLLGSFYCLLEFAHTKAYRMIFLAGILNGFCSFTKPEGFVSAGLLTGLCFIYLWQHKVDSKDYVRAILLFLGGLLITGLVTLVFQFVYAPPNLTFINGLKSLEHPSDANRLKMIGVFTLMELVSPQWRGIWILLLWGMLLGIKKIFSRDLWIVTAFVIAYLAVVLFYYELNTYFEITWWLQVTWHRILLALLPTIILAVFLNFWGSKNDAINVQENIYSNFLNLAKNS